MLIGETPGMWPSDESVRVRHFLEASPEHRARLDRLSGAVEQTLVQAMAMPAEQRHSTPNDLALALESGVEGSPKYDRQQVGEIVRRAAEMQAAEPTEGEGLSLGGVQRIAAEVGIAPEQVREVVDELSEHAQGLTMGGIFGNRPELEFERFVDVEAAKASYPDLLEEIRVTLGEVGDINETLGDALSWSSPAKGAGRKAQILVSPRQGRTRIRITDKEASPSAVVMVPISMFSLVVLGITGAILSGVGVPTMETVAGAVTAAGTFAGGTYWAARNSFRRRLRERSQRLLGLMDRMVRMIGGRKEQRRERDLSRDQGEARG
jgi:hypothetical protein